MKLKRYEFDTPLGQKTFTLKEDDGSEWAVYLEVINQWSHKTSLIIKTFTDRTKAESWFDRLVEMLKEE